MVRFDKLAIDNPADLLFGVAPKPLKTRKGLLIGGGTVYPELNFTLPTMFVDAETMPEVRRQYQQIISGALRRAEELEVPGLVIEFETLPPMTENPDWGMEVVDILLTGMEDAYAKSGLKSVLRMTPNDTREMVRPPVMKTGALFDNMIELFERSAAAGAELLSIESVGGKEVCDEALTMGDLPQAIFALSVMGARDMEFLWTRLADIAAKNGVHAAGDTACGFANTAMVLAEQKMIPRVFAAVIRAVSASRSLVAYQCGAVGPGKDCGYENVYLKAITGYPMAMEGKTAACAHLSPVGNVAAAAADTWSNESVQNVKLLGGMAPTCYLEQLAYDCRLFNRASADGKDAARQLRDWMVEPDAALDPQALVLSPDSAVRIAKEIVEADTPYGGACGAARKAIELIRLAKEENRVKVIDRESPWLDIMEASLDDLPADEGEFVAQMMPRLDTTSFRPEDYGLA